MKNFKKLSKEEMKLITASSQGGGSNNQGNTNCACGPEPDPVYDEVAHTYWKSCMESGGEPTICPPSLPTANS